MEKNPLSSSYNTHAGCRRDVIVDLECILRHVVMCTQDPVHVLSRHIAMFDVARKGHKFYNHVLC